MNWKDLLKPTKQKIILWICLLIFVPIAIVLLLDLIFPMVVSWFGLVFSNPIDNMLLTSPFYFYGSANCKYIPGGMDWSCFFLKNLLWLVTNGILYYLVASWIIYKRQK